MLPHENLMPTSVLTVPHPSAPSLSPAPLLSSRRGPNFKPPTTTNSTDSDAAGESFLPTAPVQKFCTFVIGFSWLVILWLWSDALLNM